MTIRGRLGWSAVGVLMALSATSGVASAADTGISLTSSPVSMDLTIKPGTSTTKTLQLMNNGTGAVKINMELDEFSAHGSRGQAIITQPSSSDPSAKWVSFSPASFTAPPGVWVPVKMTINLPKTAQLGYYYAVVFAPDTSGAHGARTNVVKGSNGVLVLVDTQSGNEKRAVTVTSFTASKHVYEYLPAIFTASVHNGGNIYLAPFGNIFISRRANLTNAVAVLNVNESGGNVLPNSNRDFQASWSDGFPVFVDKTVNGQVVRDKQGNSLQQLKWDFSHISKLRFGKYYAKLTLIYNNGQRTIPVTSVVSFWVIPWKLLGIGGGLILVILVLVGIGLWSTGRRFHGFWHRKQRGKKWTRY